MTVPTVFLASSSEALGVVKVVHPLLQRALKGKAAVKPWPKEFQLTKSYIESLEGLLDKSDFSVLILTPDDRTTSRKVKSLSPRDNLIFELGLFIGRLGRDRCFVLMPKSLDLKLPSDLLGVEQATFATSRHPAKPSESALHDACSRIGSAICSAIKELPSRPRLDAAGRGNQAAIRKFGDRIVGTWWERIQLKKQKPALSYFEIELDETHSSVQLNGWAYDRAGVLRANWKSAGAHVEGARVRYVRECLRTDANTAVWLPGLGEANFEGKGDALDGGHGKFWESDESRPEKTVIKLVQLHRLTDKSHVLTMRKGGKRKREALVNTILDNW